MPYSKIKIENSTTESNITEKMYNVKIFSKSREANLLKRLSEKKENYYDENLVNKLFNNYSSNGNHDNDLYLKNKYLYLTTRGVLNYLRLYDYQKQNTNRKYYQFEINKVRNHINCILQNKDPLHIISLGAANSDKEIDILNGLDSRNKTKITYYPVDISNYLIHLGIIDISSEKSLEKVEVNSIISDFWDLSSYLKDDENKKANVFGKGKRLFLLLGGTFGNYTEKEFLNQIIELMDVDDELIISLKLKGDKEIDISEEYDDTSDIDFLMEPLTYIPYFYGYARYNRDLLKKGKNAKLSANDDKKKYVSIVPDSECHSPYIEIKDAHDIDKKLRLAWTTRYDESKLVEWIEGFRSRDKNNGDFKLSKTDLKKEDNYALLFLKKEYHDYTKEILKLLNQNNLTTEYAQEKVKSMTLQEKCQLYNEIKNMDKSSLTDKIGRL